MFRKSSKAVKYIVYVLDLLTLGSGQKVTEFSTEESAIEYCNFKNKNTTDSYIKWGYYMV